MEADPSYATSLGDCARLLFICGRPAEAKRYVVRALSSAAGNKVVVLERQVYRFAYMFDAARKMSALKKIRLLIDDGVRAPNRDLSQNVARAQKDGHADADLVAFLAEVICNEPDVAALNKSFAWETASTRPAPLEKKKMPLGRNLSKLLILAEREGFEGGLLILVER